jgi:hypothetical protein
MSDSAVTLDVQASIPNKFLQQLHDMNRHRMIKHEGRLMYHQNLRVGDEGPSKVKQHLVCNGQFLLPIANLAGSDDIDRLFLHLRTAADAHNALQASLGVILVCTVCQNLKRVVWTNAGCWVMWKTRRCPRMKNSPLSG